MYVQRKSEAGLYNHYCRGSIIYSKRASAALVTQHAKRTRHIVLPYMTCLYVPHIYIYIYDLINGTIFFKKSYLSKMCVLIVCTTFI